LENFLLEKLKKLPFFKERLIVKRDPDGVLSHANWEERDAANQAFNPFPGRRWKMPKMFEPEYLNVS
jgi:Mitochondrial 28S ribosomal protein S22